jgi:hypothetical protein
MVFGETADVCCENHTELTDTVRTSQETHYVSATEPNRLMVFGETVAVYCANHTEQIASWRHDVSHADLEGSCYASRQQEPALLLSVDPSTRL